MVGQLHGLRATLRATVRLRLPDSGSVVDSLLLGIGDAAQPSSADSV